MHVATMRVESRLLKMATAPNPLTGLAQAADSAVGKYQQDTQALQQAEAAAGTDGPVATQSVMDLSKACTDLLGSLPPLPAPPTPAA